MSHEFESGFFTREPAWHGLGTVVETAPTSADALKLAGLDWRVDQSDVMVNGIAVPGYKANIRNSDNSVLGIVSDKYKIVQNTEAFDFTDSLIGEGVEYETAGSLRNGKTTWLLARLPREKVLGDDFAPYLCFTNSHDGSGAVRVCMTNTRVVCWNTLNLALNSASRMWSTRHVGNLDEKRLEAQMTLRLAAKYMNEFNKEAEELAKQKISRTQLDAILDEMFPVSQDDSDCRKQNVQEIKDAFYACYISPDLINFMNTKYGAINAMADLVDHKEPARLTKNYKENNFYRVINGHAWVDTMYNLLKATA